jgi:hypothetical protein
LRNLTSRHLNDVKNAQKNSVIAVLLSLLFLIAFLSYSVAQHAGSIYLTFWIVYLVVSILVSSYIGVTLLKRLSVTIQPSPYQLTGNEKVQVIAEGSGNSGNSGSGSVRVQPSPPSPQVNMAQPSPKQGSTPMGSGTPTNAQQQINGVTNNGTTITAPAPPPIVPLAAPLKLSPMGLSLDKPPPPPLNTSPSIGGRNMNGSSLYSPANTTGNGSNPAYFQQNISMYYGASAPSMGYVGSTPINSPNNAGMNYASGVGQGKGNQPGTQAPVRLSGTSYAAASVALRKRITYFLVGSIFCSIMWLVSLLIGTKVFNGNTFNEQFGQYLVFRYFEAMWCFILLKTFWPSKIGSYTVNVRRNGNAPSGGGSGKGSGNKGSPVPDQPQQRPKPGPHITALMKQNNGDQGKSGSGGRNSRGSGNGTPNNSTPNIVAAFNSNGSAAALNLNTGSPAYQGGALSSPMASPAGTPIQNSARRYISNPDSPAANGGINSSPRANAALASYHARASLDRGMNGTLFGMTSNATAQNTPVNGGTPLVSPTNALMRTSVPTSPDGAHAHVHLPASNSSLAATTSGGHPSDRAGHTSDRSGGGHTSDRSGANNNNTNNKDNSTPHNVSDSGTERIAI